MPNPTVPTNGQSLDATPLLANLQAVYQAIQSFDASQITAGTLTAAAFNASINPNTLLTETTFPFVSTGLVWSTVSGLSGGMTSGVLYYNGIRVSVNSVASNTFTASKDTYVDIDVNGNITYQAVTNNAASPAITANSVRVAIIVSSGAALTTINQGSESAAAPVVSSVTLIVCDSLGNLICPRDPNRKLLAMRQITASATGTVIADIAGLSALPVIVPSGRRIKLRSFSALMQSTSATTLTHDIFEGGTQIAESDVSVAASGLAQANPEWVGTPTAGLHTYKTRAGASAGNFTFYAGTTFPAYIIAELE